ncbi:MAG: hypothetical protein QOF78_2110 [Phycisphaerales bacterium]|jgi:Flp pilus assembly protein TadG|nr:hypothetical protein [Phycisphaerales bacterium]
MQQRGATIDRTGGRGFRCARGTRGAAFLYVVFVLVVILAVTLFSLDFARVHFARKQLRIATDSAAIASARWVKSGRATVLAKANDAVAESNATGVTPVFEAAGVEVGSWARLTGEFTPNGKPRNAVRLTASTLVSRMLGELIGQPEVAIDTQAVARCIPSAIVGLDGITFKADAFIGSYDSSVSTAPTTDTARVNAAIASNGTVFGRGNGSLMGDVYFGPAGAAALDWKIMGARERLLTEIAPPLEPAWNPTGNPGGATQNFVNDTPDAVYPGGTYWFTNVIVLKSMSFSGPATLYVNGDINISAKIAPHRDLPANLKIYQIGPERTFQLADSLAAQVSAPRSAFSTKGSFTFYGTCVFLTIDVRNNGEFYFDENGAAVQGVALVK